MRAEPGEDAGPARADAEGGHRLWEVRFVVVAEAAEGAYHAVAAGQAGATGVGAELATAAEPLHDQHRQEAQHDLRHEGGHEVADAAAALAIVSTAQHRVNQAADDAREKEDERIEHALNER